MRKKTLGNYEHVKSVFVKYLEDNKKRKTLERMAILEQVYHAKGRFELETLYTKVKKSRFRVSRPTLYNTLNLLIECGFVVKYKFPDKEPSYEFVFDRGSVVHSHIYNTKTQQVTDFSDVRIDRMIKDIEKKFSVVVKNCNVVLYCEDKVMKS